MRPIILDIINQLINKGTTVTTKVTLFDESHSMRITNIREYPHGSWAGVSESYKFSGVVDVDGREVPASTRFMADECDYLSLEKVDNTFRMW